MLAPAAFTTVWVVDFEFGGEPGGHPIPRCLVAKELRSGRELRVWESELLQMRHPPYGIGPDDLMVAFFASAELGCHLALGWPMPAHLLDVYVEFSALTNGRARPCGRGLLGALAYFDLPTMLAEEKEHWRTLALRGGPWTDEERAGLLDYCATDSQALELLLPKMAPMIDWPRALIRGCYMAAVARMERAGVPIDVELLTELRAGWEAIKHTLVARIDATYGVYEDGQTFKVSRFARWLQEHEIPWPRLPSGMLCLDSDTFHQMARCYPAVASLAELRHALSQLRLHELAVGADGRNRCLLSPFRARTGRNQPSSSQYIFGPSVWLRGLIRPSPGRALAYVDWSQQEFGIAAALSGDTTMQAAYSSGDPYLAFARQAGAVPIEATKLTHEATRERYKQCSLAVQYGMGAESLGERIDQPTAEARALLRTHRAVYRRFWAWSDAVLDYAHLHGRLFTAFGWPLFVGADARAPALRNYPMQGNGAELLRLACILATERGVEVVAPVHDALLIEADAKAIDDAVALTQAAMLEASRAVLSGFELRSEAKIVRYPDRYADPRGAVMWATVREALNELAREGTCDDTAQVPVTVPPTTCDDTAHPSLSSSISLVSLSSCSPDKRDPSFHISGELWS